jgi:hypothetical protein
MHNLGHTTTAPWDNTLHSPWRLTHLAGTALGDPVEVNAAAEALLVGGDAPAAQPLSLLASKSWHGHAEPAAGLVALAHAASAAAAALRHPLLHLRTLNPYVAGVFESLAARHGGGGGSGGAARGAVAARQAAPLAIGRRGGGAPAGETAVVAATSSFAFMVGCCAFVHKPQP